jgi:site-specific DNA recombinase
MTTIRAAFYARVSGEQQAAAHTIESQIAALSDRARFDGTPVPPERQFVDDGYSGATLIRPALDRLRDLVSVGAIDRIYVHSPDRLARNYAYQVLLLEEWQRRGIEVVFLNRPLGKSPEDDLLLQVQGIVAEYERAKIMERSRRGKKHAAQTGSLNVMSGAPFGYRYVSVREGGGQARFEPVAEQARVVQQIFSWIGQERCSLAEVRERNSDSAQRAGGQRNLGKATCRRQPTKKNGCLFPFPPWSIRHCFALHAHNSMKTVAVRVRGDAGQGTCCKDYFAAQNVDMPTTARQFDN